MRIKRAVNAVKKRRKIFKLSKGYYGSKSRSYRIAREAVMKSLNYAYVGRRLKKRDFRSLWITRINAAARLNGISYSKLMHGLKKAGIELNRKVLAEIAVKDAAGFTALCEKAKARAAYPLRRIYGRHRHASGRFHRGCGLSRNVADLRPVQACFVLC